MALITALMAPAGLMAQKVYKDAGRIILDMTVAAGMPADAVTSVSKRTAYASFTPNASVLGTVDGVNNDQGHPINATVFQKLEIAPYDMNTSGEMTGSGTLTMPWANAFNNCRSSTHAGGNWRIPTQREVQMMWIFRQGIEDFGSVFSSNNYWSAAEANANSAWAIDFTLGVMNSTVSKTYNYRVRCVREVTP